MFSRLVPTNLIAQLRQPRGIVVSGSILVLISLLANNAGLAIFISALVVPTAVLVDLKRRNLFDVEPWWAVTAMAVSGAIAALFITLLNILLLKQFEDESDPFSRCCGVFLGRVNLDVPEPGGLSVVAVGVVIPVIAAFLTAAGPLYLKQQPRFSDEVMDGVTLGAAAGGGYAATSAILYFWPLFTDSSSLAGSVSGWTSALIALLIIRPLIFCAATSLICAGIWHYSIRQTPSAIMIPVGSALMGCVVLAVGSLLLAGNSSLAEMLWNVAIMIALLAASRFVLRRAIGQDRRSLRVERQAVASTATPERIVCPECGALTRPGTFCGNCGASLASASVSQPTSPTEPIPMRQIIDIPTLDPVEPKPSPTTDPPVPSAAPQDTTFRSEFAGVTASETTTAEFFPETRVASTTWAPTSRPSSFEDA